MVLAIVAIALVLGGMAFGGIAGAKTKEGAGKLATAVRYAYNLAAINNKVYALYIDLNNHTFHAAPLQQTGECDRVLLALDGKDSGAVVVKFGKEKDEDKNDDEEEAGKFDAAMSGSSGDSDGGAPDWAADGGGASKKLVQMLGGEVRSMADDAAKQAGVIEEEATEEQLKKERLRKKLKTFRTNLIGKPQKLPDGVQFDSVMVRDGDEPVTEGIVPILFYPHGYTQRALIFMQDKGETEKFTVEILTLRGTGVVHSEWLDEGDFKEAVE